MRTEQWLLINLLLIKRIRNSFSYLNVCEQSNNFLKTFCLLNEYVIVIYIHSLCIGLLEKGFYSQTRILIESYAMGKDESLFPDAYSFKPERWLRGEKNAEKIHQFAVRPFGFGSRSCLGKWRAVSILLFLGLGFGLKMIKISSIIMKLILVKMDDPNHIDTIMKRLLHFTTPN